ncbi:MAG TPA: hypothetical protein VJO35_15620 [Terriglobales bacterium]|nr:hypothetical protein [Terriglobales bacterium]
MQLQRLPKDVERTPPGLARFVHQAPGWLPSWIADSLPALLVFGAFVFLGARLFRLIYDFAVNIFFWDQWDLKDATLFEKHSVWQMFAWQHGPHRQGLGALLEKAIEPYFQWSSRTESFVAGVIITIAALCALYLKKRLYGHLSVSDALIAVLFFIPGQFATLFLYTNFAHGPLPLLLIVLYCLAWTCSRTLVRYSLVLMLNFFAIYTGFGLLLGLLTPVLLIVDYRGPIPGSRAPRAYVAAAVAISLASMASFFVGYKFNSAVDCFSPQPASPTDHMKYSALMFANFFGLQHGTGIREFLIGFTAIAALLGSLCVSGLQLFRKQNGNSSDRHTRSLIAACLTSFCLLFCLATAYGRLCSGLETAHASRYMIYLELGFLGLYFQLLNIARAGIRRVLLVAVLVVVSAASWHVDRTEISSLPFVKWRWKRCYLSTGDVNHCNAAVGFPIYPDPALTHLQEKLEFLRKNRLNLFADSK